MRLTWPALFTASLRPSVVWLANAVALIWGIFTGRYVVGVTRKSEVVFQGWQGTGKARKVTEKI